MIPLTENPTAVVLLNPEGKVEAVATNVASDLKVVVVTSPADFREAACNQPFDSTRPN